MTLTHGCSIKGFAKVDVIDHEGRVIQEGWMQPNLLLDSGLDKLADINFCDLFTWAVKGNSAQDMSKVVDPANSFTLNTTSNTLTRTAGTYVFVDEDNGCTVRSDNGFECIITGRTSDTVADVVPVGSLNTLTAYTSRNITIYQTALTALDDEDDRTDTYSSVAGENSTTTATNTRTFKRTFLFDPEPEEHEDSLGVTGTWSGTTVTRVSGTRDFTSDDLGKYISFPSTGEYAKILTITNATHVVVDRSPVATTTGVSYDLYGFNSYSHVGFSDSGVTGDPLNIMIRLEATDGTPRPVLALGSNPEVPGQQVKVTYLFKVTFTPNTVQNAGNLFSDPTAAMGSNVKTSKYVLENIATSFVSSDDGGTDVSATGLEPCDGAYVALSPSGAALAPLTPGSVVPPDRSAGAAYVPMDPDDYVAGAFTRTYSGTFGINDGNTSTSALWKTLGIYDPDDRLFLFSLVFDGTGSTQGIKKPATHQFTLHFRKSWNRDLS